MSENVHLASGRVYHILDNATTTGAGDGYYKDSPYSTFQAVVEGSGAVSATVDIEVTNQVDVTGTPVNWCATPMGTITLSGTTSDSDGFTTAAPWKYVRANVTAISGTGASVDVLMGV